MSIVAIGEIVRNPEDGSFDLVSIVSGLTEIEAQTLGALIGPQMKEAILIATNGRRAEGSTFTNKLTGESHPIGRKVS